MKYSPLQSRRKQGDEAAVQFGIDVSFIGGWCGKHLLLVSVSDMFMNSCSPRTLPQQSLGDGPQKKALSRRFKSYSWIFTDSLINKLVALRIGDAAQSRAIEGKTMSLRPPMSERDGKPSSDGVEDVRVSTEGVGRAERETRWRELKRERRVCRSDIMREMTAECGTSKDLLFKVVGSWLPAVLAADRAAEST